jgi:hypothetical protein
VLAARTIEQMRPNPKAHVIVVGDPDANPAAATMRFLDRAPPDGLSMSYPHLTRPTQDSFTCVRFNETKTFGPSHWI